MFRTERSSYLSDFAETKGTLSISITDVETPLFVVVLVMILFDLLAPESMKVHIRKSQK